MIHISDEIMIRDEELGFSFIRASGPGGQNVNKVASAVQLRFDVNESPSLPEEVKTRLRKLAGRRVSDEGILIIHARRFRTRERNRQDAIERLIHLIQKAAEKPIMRKRTRPSTASREKRLENKRRRSRTKTLRKPVDPSG